MKTTIKNVATAIATSILLFCCVCGKAEAAEIESFDAATCYLTSQDALSNKVEVIPEVDPLANKVEMAPVYEGVLSSENKAPRPAYLPGYSLVDGYKPVANFIDYCGWSCPRNGYLGQIDAGNTKVSFTAGLYGVYALESTGYDYSSDLGPAISKEVIRPGEFYAIGMENGYTLSIHVEPGNTIFGYEVNLVVVGPSTENMSGAIMQTPVFTGR